MALYHIVVKSLDKIIVQHCVNQRKTLVYLKVLPENNLSQFDKSIGKYSSETCQAATKPVCK